MPLKRTAAAIGTMLAFAAGCRSGPRTAYIGIAYPGHRAARVAAAELEASPQHRDVRIIWDSVPIDPTLTFQAAQVEQATRLVAHPGVMGVVGHRGSREALMTAPIYNEAQVPFVLSGATSRRLRHAGAWTFMLAPDDSVEGEYLGRFVAEQMHARSVTVFYVVDEYGMGLRDGVGAALTRRGVRIIDAVAVPGALACTAARDPYSALVDAALRRGKPDAVILAARQGESGCIIERVRRQHPAMPFATGDGVLADSLFLRRAQGTDSLFIAGFWHPDLADSASRAFVRRFEAATGVAPNHEDAVIYDALMTLVAAIEASGGSRAEVRDWLASLGRGRPAFRGVTGAIRFPGQPDRLVMTRVEHGRVNLVSP